MKKTSLYIASLGLAAVAFSACDNEFERPPMALPTSTWEANTTIAQLKQDYWSTLTTPATVGLTESGDSVIIKGRVISSDESGNIFKYIMIKGVDEAIALSVDMKDLYKSYKFGQEIYINATGLTIGGYSGLMCIGYGLDDKGRVSRCPENIFPNHAQVSGLPNVSLIDTVYITIPMVKEAQSTAEGLQKWQSQLVRLDDVRFEEAGEIFATPQTSIPTSRYIVDKAGNKMIVSNSGYSDFQADLLPYGSGSIVGILGFYGSDWQIQLIDINGCIGFDGVATPVFSPGAGAVKPGTEVTITCATEGAEIHYTIDGSEPTITSTLYTEPIVIEENITIKAIATLEGHDASVVATARYTVSENAPTEGDGTEEKPYNVAQIIELNPTSTSDAVASDVWTSGYIVGYMPTGGSSTLLSAAVFGIGGDVTDLNLVIAASPDENNAANCIGIQLPAAIRPALNLKDNPGNLGKLLTIKGGVFKYCGGPGIKNGSEYKLDGEGGGTVTPEPPVSNTTTFKAVSAITSGKSYAIVADGKMATSFGTASYGYMKTVDVTVADATFNGSADNAFIFTAVEGGYTIQEATGRYVYMTGTYNSFNLSDSLPTSGHVWTVAFGADGKVVITNVEMNKSIQYDSQYGSYGSYPDVRGSYPQLFEAVD